jgi:hypothetical protein
MSGLHTEVEIPEQAWIVIHAEVLFEALKRVERGHTAEEIFAEILEDVSDPDEVFADDEDDDDLPVPISINKETL